MTYKLIQLNDLSFSISNKCCFKNFTATIAYGQRIAIIGQNGSGKSSLLRLLLKHCEPSEGEVLVSLTAAMGYVPQLINEFSDRSGGEKFQQKLTQALASFPNILLLDEPTNHLDRKNRQSLMRMLRSFEGTLLIVTHDLDLLEQVVDTIWHIDQEQIRVFTGNYEDYQRELNKEYQSIEQELSSLSRQKKQAHYSLMKEQERAKNSRKGGEKKIENRKWPTIVASSKMRRANETANRKKSEINQKAKNIVDKISSLHVHEVLKPSFSIEASESMKGVILIDGGSVGFDSPPILSNLHFSMKGAERVAILGDNGSGKSTFFKAILGQKQLVKTGEWQLLKAFDIGYLDQHYSNLKDNQTVLECIQNCVSGWSHEAIRKHLNDFLFRKNEEINKRVACLSGGEKARLSLAQIAAKTPKLLLLDEITNNLDLETREHVIQVLKSFPGAMMVISHDRNFLTSIGIGAYYKIQEGLLKLSSEEAL